VNGGCQIPKAGFPPAIWWYRGRIAAVELAYGARYDHSNFMKIRLETGQKARRAANRTFKARC